MSCHIQSAVLLSEQSCCPAGSSLSIKRFSARPVSVLYLFEVHDSPACLPRVRIQALSSSLVVDAVGQFSPFSQPTDLNGFLLEYDTTDRIYVQRRKYAANGIRGHNNPRLKLIGISLVRISGPAVQDILSHIPSNVG